MNTATITSEASIATPPTTEGATVTSDAALAPAASFEARLSDLKKQPEGDKILDPVLQPETQEMMKARADRSARIKSLQEKERAADARRQTRPKQAPRDSEEIASLRQRVTELSALAERVKTPDGLFTLAEENNLTPQQLAEHLRDALHNPQKVAAQEAKKALSPLEGRLLAKIESLENEIGGLKTYNQQASSAAEEREAASELLGHVQTSARLAPRSAAYLQKFGSESLISFATQIANQLPPGVGLQAVHDAIEEALDSLADIYQPSHLLSQKTSIPKSAAAKANKTVSNALASQRSSVADVDAEFAALPFDERLAVLKRRAG